jgi:hypothetical protein
VFVRLAPEGFEEVSVTILFKTERIFLEARLGKNGRYTFSPYEDEALSLLPAGRKAKSGNGLPRRGVFITWGCRRW